MAVAGGLFEFSVSFVLGSLHPECIVCLCSTEAN